MGCESIKNKILLFVFFAISSVLISGCSGSAGTEPTSLSSEQDVSLQPTTVEPLSNGPLSGGVQPTQSSTPTPASPVPSVSENPTVVPPIDIPVVAGNRGHQEAGGAGVSGSAGAEVREGRGGIGGGSVAGISGASGVSGVAGDSSAGSTGLSAGVSGSDAGGVGGFGIAGVSGSAGDTPRRRSSTTCPAGMVPAPVTVGSISLAGASLCIPAVVTAGVSGSAGGSSGVSGVSGASAGASGASGVGGFNADRYSRMAPIGLPTAFSDPLKERLDHYENRKVLDLLSQSLVPIAYADCKANLARAGRLEINIASFLESCPYIEEKLVWEQSDGSKISYLSWSGAQKDKLQKFFKAIVRTAPLNVDCPDMSHPPLIVDSLYFTANQAFEMYAAQVAHILWVEATDAVPWTLFAMPPDEIATFFDSSYYHSRLLAPMGRVDYPLGILPGRDYQSNYQDYYVRSVVCDLREGFQFMNGTRSTSHLNLIGSTQEETLVNLSQWFADNVVHGDVISPLGHDAEIASNSSLKDRLRGVLDSTTGRRVVWARPGCRGASVNFRQLARSVNIPILHVVQLGADYERSDFRLPVDETSPIDGERTRLTTRPLPDDIFPALSLSSHGALAFHWTQPTALFLQHTDDIYSAYNYRFSLPIRVTSENTVVPDSTHQKERFFVSTWLTQSEITGAGYVYFSDMPFEKRGPYRIFESKARLNFVDAPDLGRMSGYWPLLEGDRDGINESRLADKQFKDLLFDTCSWKEFVEEYCTQTQTAFLLQSAPLFERTNAHVVRPMSVTQWYQRAASCALAYGGCDRARSSYNDWLHSVGSNVWQDPSE